MGADSEVLREMQVTHMPSAPVPSTIASLRGKPKHLEDCFLYVDETFGAVYDLKRLFALWGYYVPTRSQTPLLEYRAGYEIMHNLQLSGYPVVDIRLRRIQNRPNGDEATDIDVVANARDGHGNKHLIYVEVISGRLSLSKNELLTIGGIPKWDALTHHDEPEWANAVELPEAYWVYIAGDKQGVEKPTQEVENLLAYAELDLSRAGIDFKVKRSALPWNGIRAWPHNLRPHNKGDAMQLVEQLNKAPDEKGIEAKYRET